MSEIDNSANPYRAPASRIEAAAVAPPSLDSPEALEAVENMNNGATAGFIVAGLTAVVATIAVVAGGGGEALGGIDGWAYIDVTLILGLAIGTLRKSRFAAVALLVYFVLAKIYTVATTGNVGGLVVALIIGYYLTRAVQGSFTYARLQREASPGYRRQTSWFGKVVIGLAIPLGLLMVIGGAQLVGEAGGWVPPTRVLKAGELSEEVRAQLVESGVLDANEVVEYMYCDGLTFSDAGVILSDRGVTRYFSDELGELQVYGLPFNQIGKVEKVEDGNFIEDSVYRVGGIDPEAWFLMALPVEEEQDRKFVDAILEAVAKTR